MSANLGAVLVVDVGGSHVSTAICLSPELQLTRISSSPLPPESSIEQFLSTLASGSQPLKGNFPPLSGASVAIAGPFDYVQGISLMRHKFQYLYGISLKTAIAQRFGLPSENVLFLNDAEAFLLGEIGAGAARNSHKAIGITLGTGIGSAFAVDGKITTTGLGVPPQGEIWDLPYESGIIEDLISTRALQASYLELTGLSLDVATIASLAASQQSARDIFVNFGRQLGNVLLHVAAQFSPDIIVIGGGISRSSHLFLPAASSQLQGSGIHLRVSRQLDHAPLIGAAVSWYTHIRKQCIHEPVIPDAL